VMGTILIDPGHGGAAAGKVVGSLREADLNMVFSSHVAQELIGYGHRVEMTRYLDRDVELVNRVAHEQRICPDLFLSMHCNGFKDPSVHGMEVFTSPGETASDMAAGFIIDAMRNALPNRKFRTDDSDGDEDREANFYVLKNTRGPAVLVECEFMTNPHALQWLVEPGTAKAIGVAVAGGVNNWFKKIKG
jgi:N-acetylmuramoyl-L-alanine amidase